MRRIRSRSRCWYRWQALNFDRIASSGIPACASRGAFVCAVAWLCMIWFRMVHKVRLHQVLLRIVWKVELT
jgi:hypothetical protein